MRTSATAALRGRGTRFLLTIEETRALALAVIAESGLDEALPPADELAVALGYRVLGCSDLPAGPQLYLPGRVAYRNTADPIERMVRIAHSLSHTLLCELGAHHTDADAWRLTVELVAPVALRPISRAPDWLIAVSEPFMIS